MDDIKFEIRQAKLHFRDCTTLMDFHHLHNEIELIYARKGKSLCHVDNKTFELTDGKFCLVFPNQIHYFTDCTEGEYFLFIFSAELLLSMQNLFHDFHPETNLFAFDEKYSELLTKLIHEDSEYIENIQAGVLNILLSHFLKETTLVPKVKSSNTQLQQILDYCAQNFDKDISLGTISSALYLNADYISFLFNKKLNIKFNQYINSLRVNKACNLMKTQNKSLAYIAEESGFGSIRTFNRVFRQTMNITPLKYYKEVNKNAETE